MPKFIKINFASNYRVIIYGFLTKIACSGRPVPKLGFFVSKARLDLEADDSHELEFFFLKKSVDFRYG